MLSQQFIRKCSSQLFIEIWCSELPFLKMGGLESRFTALLVEGSEKGEEALEMWKSNADLQANFKPNAPIKSSPVRDTPLHCAARFEMRELLSKFLEIGGDPFVRNSNDETPLHTVCSSAKFSSRRSKRKAGLLQLLLEKIPEISGEDTYNIIRSASSLENGDKGSSILSSWALSSFKSANGVASERKSRKNNSGGNEFNLGVQDKVRSIACIVCTLSCSSCIRGCVCVCVCVCVCSLRFKVCHMGRGCVAIRGIPLLVGFHSRNN